MSERNYKQAFAVASVICVVLAVALGYLLLHHDRAVATSEDTGPVVAKGPEMPDQPSSSDTAASSSSSAPVLAPIQISPQRLQAIGVKTAVVEMRTVSDELRVPGNVEVNEQQLAYVQSRFPGWIQKVFANATYQYVRKGDPLFTIYSQEVVSTEQEYLLAKQNQKAFSSDEHGAVKDANWLLQAATDRLRQLGVSPQAIANLEQTGKVQRELTVESPVSGYITERNALPNLYVQPETKLYTIADFSTVWVYANVFQTDIGHLKSGDSAAVTTDAYPGRTFKGRIDQILPQVDAMTRTARVRLVFSNPGIVLKPGMYVNVSIGVPLGRQLVIPASGVLQAGTRQIAFIDHGEGNLEPREIEVGQRLDDHVVVLKGLRNGERIVSSANFLVDSESQLQAAMGSFAPPPSGAGQSAAMNLPAERVTVDFSTEPESPHKGANTVLVKLTGSDGKPVTGAQATATFFMPAMPAMGMAAARSVAILKEKGAGVYEGTLQLQSGGTWQVTVLAQRDGKTIATKQLSVTATGGM
jgi:Cu(I)/Ag(I) efflux system membrane fusion protein/cobalt-zinc-cadmium efflux system membrane fusion protein